MQLTKIFHNSQNPWSEWPISDMLISIGWKVCGTSNSECIYIPPWNSRNVNECNYMEKELNVDYFVDTDDSICDLFLVSL